MINWFPLRDDLISNPDFQACTVAEKLHYLLLVSEFNLRGEFYRPDLWFASVLRLSESKIKKARKKFQRLGWIETKKGQWKRGRNIATTYKNVKWARTPQQDSAQMGETVFFAQIHRYAFEVILSYVRKQQWTLSECSVWVSAAYGYCRYQMNKECDNFFMTKEELQRLSGVKKVAESVQALHNKFSFSGGAHLFEPEDKWQKIVFKKWATFGEPLEGNNTDGKQKIENDIAECYKRRKDSKKWRQSQKEEKRKRIEKKNARELRKLAKADISAVSGTNVRDTP